MKKTMFWILVGLSVGAAVAEPLKIVGFETGSGITFQGATVSNYYTLEFATSLAGPWTNWGSVTEQPITGPVMTASTPFVFRIRQTDSSSFPPYATTSHTHSNITSSMLASSAVQTANIGAGAVTESKLSASGTLVPSLNADLLDGLHAAQIAGGGSSFPAGGIIMWSGTSTNIPSGWSLCDGSNGTPNLMDRFIIGAGSNYTAGTTGGSVSHTHSLIWQAPGSASGAPSKPTGVNPTDALPPYYALCFIMKQ